MPIFGPDLSSAQSGINIAQIPTAGCGTPVAALITKQLGA